MKITDIQTGGIYYDGKFGVREVVSKGPRVTYKILAAKNETEYSYADKETVSIIGTSRTCDLASFA